MDRDFEPFRAGPNEARSLRLHVTISRQRILRINRNVFEKLGRPESVRLSYSRERDAIGIEAASPRLNDAFPLIPVTDIRGLDRLGRSEISFRHFLARRKIQMNNFSHHAVIRPLRNCRSGPFPDLKMYLITIALV